jgi:hypothetical protein
MMEDQQVWTVLSFVRLRMTRNGEPLSLNISAVHRFLQVSAALRKRIDTEVERRMERLGLVGMA